MLENVSKDDFTILNKPKKVKEFVDIIFQYLNQVHYNITPL